MVFQVEKEGVGKNCVRGVSYSVISVDDTTKARSDEPYTIILDRPEDEDMLEYSSFVGDNDSNLVAAIKAQLGSDKVAEIEKVNTDRIETINKKKEESYSWVSLLT